MIPVSRYFEAQLWLLDGGRTMRLDAEQVGVVQLYLAHVEDEEAAEECL